MREFGNCLHVVDVSAFEYDMRECDEGGVFVDGAFELEEVGGDVVVGGGDAKDFVFALTPSPSPAGRGG